MIKSLFQIIYHPIKHLDERILGVVKTCPRCKTCKYYIEDKQSLCFGTCKHLGKVYEGRLACKEYSEYGTSDEDI